MAKAKSSPATKAAKKRPGCARKLVSFTTKRGKRIEFDGRLGKGCGPRRKPTPPPKIFRDSFRKAAKKCKGMTRGKFLNCMATQSIAAREL